MKSNIKVIIFDLGGVLVPEKRDFIDDHISRLLKITKNNLRKLYKNINNKLTKGEVSLGQFYSKILKKIKVEKEITSSELVQKHIELYKKCQKRNINVLRLIEKLKKKYLVVCLVNTEIEIAKINKEAGLYDIFSKSFISTDMKIMKPNLNIYKTVLRQLGVKSKEVVFIDDKEKNVKAAKTLGINGILFTNVKDLKISLKRILSNF
ncbi:MAG: HAD family phosphatase [Candidatus Paceibacterota bacterium]